ncbi:hypothetical protein CPB84DRAFT_1720486 [Gymnopilus junonius]|uniref:Uncharacterized protein n=1 Tax=Gymnopilus junonius TaxID=109634 RepID=A0A9P5NYE1_GYMJU|nr:hypothetical protein CPB84DRAFT_1720486 [Gymnopilus junonius]
MPASELSDALNPYASQGRQRIFATEYSPPVNTFIHQPQPVVSPPQQYVPHVSELHMAIAEPSPQPVNRTRHPAQIVAELYRRVAATQSAQEAEQKRRLEWEQEQEAKYTQRQAEMEKTMLEMTTEIKALRATVDNLTTKQTPVMTGLPTPPQYMVSPVLSQQIASSVISSHSISLAPQASLNTQPMFIQGSSNNPLPNAYSNPSNYSMDTNTVPGLSPQSPPQPQIENSPHLSVEAVGMAMTPDPSSHFTSPEPSRRNAASPRRTEKRKKTRRKSYHSEDEDSSASSSSARSSPPRKKRTSHHDTKCYTIHHAMRTHILKMMDLETDKQLPDSHAEGTQLDPTEPIRFVWDKTTKQSVHNARMKTRVLDDIKDKRRLYKDVSSKDFSKKVLDGAFEQCFVTLRQKYKTQRDALAASLVKKREDGKARKARHLSRKKIKLDNRAEARNKIAMFEHVTFDGALQLDCMSSEESDTEMDPHSSQPFAYLKTRGYAWRSSRLLQFYYVLDEEERIDFNSKPKRGQGKKERRVGPNKEEFVLPPQGVATWMISRRWYRDSLASRPDLPHILDKLIIDPAGFDWTQFHNLGEESADEDVPQQQMMFLYNPEMHMNMSIPHQQYDPGIFMTYTL